MKASRRHVLRGHHGFTLVELLVVILIIGVLAAIAIPLFVNQKGKATAANGKEIARTAAEAAETYSTDHSGFYTELEPKALHEYEPSIQITAGNNNAYLSAAEATEGGRGYFVTATATDGNTFTWTKYASGQVVRTCKVKAGNNSGGCQTGSW